MTLATGQILAGRYRIVKKLGEGGFGAVYRAWDMNLNKACALKENLATSPVQGQQFQREAQILSVLSHPNLARVTDYFELPNQGQYLVMDYIDGEDLETTLAKARLTPGVTGLPESQVLTWVMQICDALIYLHSQNPPVIHRDIKPANIRIDPNGRAVLVDFGIAKLYDPSRRTTQGARAVTSGYSPPEQYGTGSTDPRSDIYALAATTYHLLTGIVPPDGLDVYTRQTAPPPPANQVNPAVSPGMGAALQRAMQGDANLRYVNVSSFKNALQSAQLTATMVAPPVGTGTGAGGWAATMPAGAGDGAAGIGSAPPVIGKGQSRRGMWIGLAAILGIIVIGLCGFLGWRLWEGLIGTSPTEAVIEETTQALESTESSAIRTAVLTDTPPPFLTDTPNFNLEPTFTLLPTAPPVVAPLSGNGIVRLTFGDGNYYRAVLSPDQRALVSAAQVGSDAWSLFEIDPNNGGIVRTILADGANYYLPAFSSDGKRLLVASDRGGPIKIYEIDFANGQVLRQLTDGPGADSAPSWFPGEGSFAFQSDRDGDEEIYIAHTDGGSPTQLTSNDAFDGSPIVSPDGRYVVFYSNRTGGGDIYLYDVQLGEERRLTSNNGREAEPYFSPDGQWVVFERSAGSDYHIWATRIDGGEELQVTGEAGRQQMPSFSPDGRWVVYHVAYGPGVYDIYRKEW